MTRKALPKAITQKFDGLQAIGGAVTDEPRKKPELARTPPQHEEAPAPAPPVVSLHKTRAVLAPATSSPPIDSEPAPFMIEDEQHVLRRRAMALKIVERYRLCAAVGGLFPLPIVNVASVTAINVRMVKTLSNLYGVPFERDKSRSIIIGFIGGAAPSGLAAATASTLALVIPGSGLFGLAVSSFGAAAFTRHVGLVFIERFEKAVHSKL